MTTTAAARTRRRPSGREGVDDEHRVDPRTLVEPAWVPPIERIAPRLAHLLHRRPLRFGEATARIGAYVYGNLVVLGALLAMTPSTAVSVHGALTVLAAGLSTFVAHAFADLLAHRVGHGHRSVLHAAAHAVRSSLPVVTSTLLPIAVLGLGAWLDWAAAPTALAADFAVCARIGLVGAAAERFRGAPSSRRLVLVGVAIAGLAAAVAVAKVLLAGE